MAGEKLDACHGLNKSGYIAPVTGPRFFELREIGCRLAVVQIATEIRPEIEAVRIAPSPGRAAPVKCHAAAGRERAVIIVR